MPAQKTVAVIVGSLRRDSFSKKIAHALVDLAPEGLRFDFVDLAGLSMYNQDLEATPPSDWTTFRERVRAADAVLFVTPEYNRSVPGVLKNAIDVGSRPYGQSVFSGKPAAVLSTSPGAMGGFGANHHPSPIAGVSRHADHDAARGLCRQRRDPRRRRRQGHGRGDARFLHRPI